MCIKRECMKQYLRSVSLMLLIIYHCPIAADAIITLFLRQYPVINEDGTLADQEHAQAITDGLKNPGKIAHYQVHGILGKGAVSGMFATYVGFLGVSDTNGQLMFPGRYRQPFVYLLITERITPIMMAGNTVHHWELEDNVPAAYYKIEQQVDPDTQLTYWDVEKAELPHDKVIPLESITLFTKPKNVYVPTGITVTKPGTNLVLPDIYVKKGAKIYPSTAFVLNIRQFFAPDHFLFQQRPDGYSQLINP